jgi:hypothetical protein
MDNKPIVFTEDTELIQGNKYIIEDIGIAFTYDPNGNNEKPFELCTNKYRLNHIPTKTDKRINGLVNLSNMTEEERKAIASKGGKTSKENQAKRKSFRDSLDMILSIKASKEEIESLPKEVRQYFDNIGYIPTKEDLINIRAVELSIVGSDKHMIFARDTVGEKPTDKQEVTAEVYTPEALSLLEKISNRLNNQ